MKIPETTNAHMRPNVNKTSPSKDAGGAGRDETVEGGGAAGRDFASVLEDVARPRERAGADDEGDGELFDSKTSERADGEPEARRREERDGSDGGDGKGGGFDQRGGVREVAPTQDATGARAILHIADLERIVSAVRTQTLASGAREVTLEMRRSVLEGLRVKLSIDGSGRVSAEFIASSERVRAQLDARAPELAEILRSRGVNLASLRTTVGADASDSGAHGRSDSGAHEGAGPVGSFAPAATADELSSANDDEGRGESAGTTYRG